MNITNEKNNNFCVIIFDERIDPANSTQFADEIIQDFNTGEHDLIIDCSGRNNIYNSGLRIFGVAPKIEIPQNRESCICHILSGIK